MRGGLTSLSRFSAAVACSALAAGCFVPGGGWTVRTGLDMRTLAKPAMFLETVDTRWDEWNRVAIQNAKHASLSSAAVYPAERTPGSGANAAPAESERPPAEPPGPDYFNPPRFSAPPASGAQEPNPVPGVRLAPENQPLGGPSAKQVLYMDRDGSSAGDSRGESNTVAPNAVPVNHDSSGRPVALPAHGEEEDQLLNLNSQHAPDRNTTRLVGAQVPARRTAPRPGTLWLFSRPKN